MKTFEINEKLSETQCERILNYILTNGSITSLEATNKLNIMSLHRRLSDLKEQGYEFNKERVHAKSVVGDKVIRITYNRYSIKQNTK